jgi:AcrR family transcriptional regulator
MPQTLKDEVKDAITAAALDVFSTKGYAAATMAEIAQRAGVSTGNVYRYFAGKEALLDAVVPPAMPRRLMRLMRQRVEAYGAPGSGAPATPHALASETLLEFTIAHRRAVVFLLAKASGSRHETFAAKLVKLLVDLALEAPGRAGPEARDAARYMLARIYENLVATTARILGEDEDDAWVRRAVTDYGRYHLAGLQALLGV